MSTEESDSMATLITTLCTSFKQVPPAAVPAVLDCILASTALSRSSLFASLLDTFTKLYEDVIINDGKLDSDHCNYLASLVEALCHLLKKFDTINGALESFIWRTFLPLMNMTHMFDRNILNQVMESFINAVIETNNWVVLEATLVPFFLRLVATSLGMPENEVSDNFQLVLETNDLTNHLEVSTKNILSPPGSPSLPISCHILNLMLDAALQRKKTAVFSESMIANGCYNDQNFAGKLTWGLCSLTEKLLLQSLEHRSCATDLLLPIIFKAFSSYSFTISIRGQTFILSRNNFFMKIWKCCGTLFSLGTVERRDAFGVLSLYLSFFPFTKERGDADMGDKAEGFDIRVEKEFWEEIKRGLVDKECLVRKQSLHILKISLCISEIVQSSGVSDDIIPSENHSNPHNMTKRELWADKEAKSLGVGQRCSQVESSLNGQQKWEAFVLLYEMLEEFGTHLVEAAWNYQVSLLLQCSTSHGNPISSMNATFHQNPIETPGEIFNWLAILWERGFNHDNPQVRCLIMQSFLRIDWEIYGTHTGSVPRYFVLGSLIQGLNDPVHHKEFGIKGIYSSTTIEGASKFFTSYTSYLNVRKCIVFLSNLASAARLQSLGRVGLMCLSECISSAACQVGKQNNESEAQWLEDGISDMIQVGNSPQNDKIVLLDALRFIIERSKQHFNPNYRLRVCEKVLESAASVVCTYDLPLDVLLHFISTFPWEFTDYSGLLRLKLQEWLTGCGKKHCNFCGTEMKLLKSLHDFPNRFTSRYMSDASITFDDEDLDAWESEAKRWARVLFLACREEHQLIPILKFIQNRGSNLCRQDKNLDQIPVKFLILALSLVLELQMMQERVSKHGSEFVVMDSVSQLSHADAPSLYQQFTNIFLLILEELVSFADFSCHIFSNSDVTQTAEVTLPGSVTGKLGGPSQRRLSASTTTTVLQAIMSMKAVATISSWCSQFKSDVSLDLALKFLWDFYQKTISATSCDSETGAEICLAAYEALAPTLSALASVSSLHAFSLAKKYDSLLPSGGEQLETLFLSFLQNINNLLAVGVFVRTRRAVLMNWKWICLESLLSIPCYALRGGLHPEENKFFFSGAALRCIFTDILESLENAGEGSVLPMLRSVRLVLDLFAENNSSSLVSLCDEVDSQMMWHLVRSSWILHVSCNKRKVAPIAALLSSVLHSSLFSDDSMHIIDGEPGPLKWFVEKILEEGTKSPRTIRLAALHLTGLWLSYPRIIKYYVKELKLLSLHGSVAFDEDFEGELADNRDTRAEVSLLAKGPDPELTKAFINTELYARASVAVLFHKLANMSVIKGSTNDNEDCDAALESGKMFLLDLLDSVVNDKDLAKELYKKYSAIHRRKVRAWQMICILSPFVCQDIVSEASHCLYICLHRNNLPAVRQYLETFAINMYLKFPPLVGEQLVPVLRDYDMRPQALSSYVFIAANVILHSSQSVQYRHLEELLPPIVSLLTSHHHSLRGFAQLLVYQVLCKMFPSLDSKACENLTLEKRCFEDLKFYLAKNSDCVRLRASMEGYLDAYSPKTSATPAGVFVNRVEEIEFECVPTSFMEQVLNFLNDVREELRTSMAKDVVTIKNESLGSDENQNSMAANSKERKSRTQLSKNISLDFQKKITLSKHEKQDRDVNSFLGNQGTYKQLLEMEKDDKLLDQVLQSRTLATERERSSRQHIILVASLLDRIPNLAGLARTCEVFKASCLAVADTNVLHDKQFQLISVTAEKWVPIIEVPVDSLKVFLERKKREGFSILGLEQTANSIPLDQYIFPKNTVLVLGREKEGIPVDIIHKLDACVEIPQLGVVRSLNVHVSGAIALWEYTRQQRSQ